MSQPPSPTHSQARAPSTASHHSEHHPEPDHMQKKEPSYQPRRSRSLSLSSDESSQSSRGRGRLAHHPRLESDAEDHTRALERRPPENRRVAVSEPRDGGRQVGEKRAKNKKAPVSLRLDMDLDIEAEVRAKIKGDITLSLLDGSE
ncbi:hypothetical protein FIBSPDRAFT_271165 [Athelia psychrophila]|uniref:Uncharacterized protein n=1 Tax=Athelia psychrophila TaxID=1759441 RepID=A0A165WWU8_9AGAM|nr:hypothetical protein FIBSPDRAFT_271165 [Fibularhizoctonia sp. CBS 109695]